MYLQAKDLARLSCACTEMREAAATTELWRPLFEVSNMSFAANLLEDASSNCSSRSWPASNLCRGCCEIGPGGVWRGVLGRVCRGRTRLEVAVWHTSQGAQVRHLEFSLCIAGSRAISLHHVSLYRAPFAGSDAFVYHVTGPGCVTKGAYPTCSSTMVETHSCPSVRSHPAPHSSVCGSYFGAAMLFFGTVCAPANIIRPPLGAGGDFDWLPHPVLGLRAGTGKGGSRGSLGGFFGRFL